jgi:hypothetical protein
VENNLALNGKKFNKRRQHPERVSYVIMYGHLGVNSVKTAASELLD